MKVRNMTGRTGKPVANQFIISHAETKHCPKQLGKLFQSYNATIAFIPYYPEKCEHSAYLDKTYWDYSRTTGKYRNQFLNESKAETERKIASGEYKLVDLNS